MASKLPQTHCARKYQIQSVQDIIPGINTVDVMDTASCLSRINHRLYRQGRSYKLKVDVDTRSMPTGAVIDVYALMPSWWVHESWRLAKKSYDEALSDEMRTLAKGNLARWRDFRVASGISNPFESGTIAPQQFVINGSATGVNITPSSYTDGEFNWSRVENLDSNLSMFFSWPSYQVQSATEFDMLQEYNDSRNESSSPEVIITDMPYSELASDANADDYIELQANGNEPPYDATSFNTAVWVRVGHLQSKSLTLADGFTSSTGFFDAPCGLVLLDQSPDTVGFTKLNVEVAKGDYRGVHAPSM